MAYKNGAQQMVSVGVPIEYDGQDKDMKALAERLKSPLGRLMWQSLHSLYKEELTQIQQERIRADGK